MSTEDTSESPGNIPTSTHSKSLIIILGTLGILFSGWIVLGYTHYSYLQGYVSNIISASLSTIRLALIVCFGGTLLSIPFLARRPHRRQGPKPPSLPLSLQRSTRVHPLMLTPRPARDSSFVIRKTTNRGRISRNRNGERLPPSNPE